MARKPPNVSWLGFSKEQSDELDRLDHLGNNGWARNPQTELLMPKVMGDLERVGLSLAQAKQAMESIGYSKRALHQLERW